MKRTDLIPTEITEKKIYILREQMVMLDFHLAELYGIETKTLKRVVKRNIERFSSYFCFQFMNGKLINLKYRLAQHRQPQVQV